MVGFLDWWGSNVSHTDDTSTSDLLLWGLVLSPFALHWLWRKWNE